MHSEKYTFSRYDTLFISEECQNLYLPEYKGGEFARSALLKMV